MRFKFLMISIAFSFAFYPPISPVLKAHQSVSCDYENVPCIEICPGFNANEIPIPYDKHHKVSSLVKSHLNTHNSVKYEVV